MRVEVRPNKRRGQSGGRGRSAARRYVQQEEAQREEMLSERQANGSGYGGPVNT